MNYKESIDKLTSLFKEGEGVIGSFLMAADAESEQVIYSIAVCNREEGQEPINVIGALNINEEFNPENAKCWLDKEEMTFTEAVEELCFLLG